MLGSAAVARIQRGLGFRSDLSDEILSALQEAQDDLEAGKTLPYFLLEEDQSLVLPSGQNSISLPSVFIREFEDEPIRYVPEGEETPFYVKRRRWDEAVAAYADHDAAGPAVYVLRENSLYFLPTADQEYTLTWSYYRTASAVSLNGENAWLAHRIGKWWLIGQAGVIIARDLRDADGLAIFEAMATRARTALFSELVTRELSGGQRAMGETN